MKRVLIFLGSMAMAACTTSATDEAFTEGGGKPSGDGGGGRAGEGSGTPEPGLGADQNVTAFDGTHVYFAAENHRTVDVAVSFPEAGPLFDRITLNLALRCPSGLCDWWDRLGWLSVVRDEGGQQTEIEILRFVTPYRVPGSWQLDVTDLRPLLAGKVTLRAFIDTWVGPGHANGDGWLVDASFDFHGGKPKREAIAAIPVWPPAEHEHGDPAKPLALEASITLPVDAGTAILRSFVTGHGQGNAGNCAEFCSLEHHLEIAGDPRTRTVWRDDCPDTAVPDQLGSWRYSRAGWCPGATVEPWTEDLQMAAKAGSQLTLAYGVEDYVNTCRPDASTCTGCTLGTGCDYDGGAHTAPKYYVSSLLILFR
jgi:hypothetical protein